MKNKRTWKIKKIESIYKKDVPPALLVLRSLHFRNANYSSGIDWKSVGSVAAGHSWTLTPFPHSSEYTEKRDRRALDEKNEKVTWSIIKWEQPFELVGVRYRRTGKCSPAGDVKDRPDFQKPLRMVLCRWRRWLHIDDHEKFNEKGPFANLLCGWRTVVFGHQQFHSNTIGNSVLWEKI